MTAIVDGESWAAAIVGTGSGVAQDDAVVGNKVLEPGGYVLSFTGRQIDGDTGTAITVSFASNGTFSLGDYTIVDGALPIRAGIGLAQVTWKGSKVFDGVSGTATLTSYGTVTASGSFHFVVRHEPSGAALTITNGQFRAAYVTL